MGTTLTIKLPITLLLSLIMFACSEQAEISDDETNDKAKSIYQDQLKALEKAKRVEEDLHNAAEKRAQQIQQQGR